LTRLKSRAVTPREVAERLRSEARVVVATHEAPDGDALGCLSAFVLMCERLGLDCIAYVPGTGGFPDEYRFLPGLNGVTRGCAPTVEAGATVYFLDCASLLRGDSDGFAAEVTRVNIDHHQDNPGFGDLNLVDIGASSTTAILYEVFKAGGFPIDAEVATALYVGLLTDTGKFQYSNTTPEAHRIAAELQEMGCDINAVNREVYESVPLPKVLLLARILSRLEIRLDGVLVTSWLGNGDFAEAGAHEGHSEGLIDTLRCIAGVRVAVLARERQRNGQAETKVSLRSTDGSVDVAAIAHSRGGGGHTRAAGFTTDGSADAVLEWIEDRVGALL
jgi:phosphoesterase RecJ-like protein